MFSAITPNFVAIGHTAAEIYHFWRLFRFSAEM